MVRDGQRYLLERFARLSSARWQAIDRYRPGTWLPSFPGRLARMHPKRFWPLWALWPARNTVLGSCDVLVNASGPFLFSGRTFHSLVEPWALLLPRALRAPRAPLFLNLAFGSNLRCLDYPVERRAVLAGQKRLTRRLCGAAALTTCRDALAARIVSACDLPHETLPCPSLFAVTFHEIRRNPGGYIALNFHPKGNRSRHDLRGVDRGWIEAFRGLVDRLRRSGRAMRFVFHEPAEQEAARAWLDPRPGEEVMPRTDAEFLQAYADADAAVTCRVHGVYAAASAGVPTVGIGSDSRLLMVDLLDLPRFHASRVAANELHGALLELLRNAESHRRRLLDLVATTEQRYLALLEPHLGEK